MANKSRYAPNLPVIVTKHKRELFVDLGFQVKECLTRYKHNRADKMTQSMDREGTKDDQNTTLAAVFIASIRNKSWNEKPGKYKNSLQKRRGKVRCKNQNEWGKENQHHIDDME